MVRIRSLEEVEICVLNRVQSVNFEDDLCGAVVVFWLSAMALALPDMSYPVRSLRSRETHGLTRQFGSAN